jgi:prepilin-type N-terminal cleavage/methylation domain-containing protein
MQEHFSTRARRRHGFTLLELMMVIVIASLTLAIAVKGLAAAQNRIRVDRAAAVLSDDIQSAFALVGRDRKPVRVVYDAPHVRFLLTDRSGVNIFRTRSLGLDTEYKMTGSTIIASDTAFEIYPPGLAESALTITLKKGVGSPDPVTRILTISRAGLVSVNNFK